MNAPEFHLQITRPQLPRAVLDRIRLMQIWDKIHERTAIIVAAPAGFGKTTLLLQWHARWLEHHALVAWVNADTQDQPGRFTAVVLRALHQASASELPSPATLQHARTAEREIETLGMLLAEIGELDRDIVLIIDEAERLPQVTLQRSVRYLLLNAPPNLHIVFGSRQRLPLDTTDLVVSGNLAELAVKDLRLRLEESIEIVQHRLGPRLTLNQCAQLHDLTEGWPAGLLLAVAKVEHEDDPAKSIASISSRRGDLQTYFMESLFSRMEPGQQDFLVRTAILEYLSAELCQAVTDDDDAAARLDRLALELPTVAMGDSTDWIRPHPLARDFLLSQFELLPGPEQTRLHLRASNWLADHERHHEAARHALAAGDETRAHGLAIQSLWLLSTQGRLNEAREWLDRIPPDFIESNTPAKLSAAAVLALGKDNAHALRSALEIADDPRTRPDLFKVALRIAGAAAAYADDLGGLSAVLSRWPETTADDEDPLCAVAPLNGQALVELHTGSSDEVRRLAGLVSAHGNAGSLRLAEALSRVLTGLSHLRDGNANVVKASLRPILTTAENDFGRRSLIACVYASVLAAALLECGDLSQAQAVLANRLDIIETSFPDTILIAYRTLVRIEAAQGDERRALGTLDNLDALAAQRNLPRLHMHALAERIRIHAWHHRHDTVGDLLRALDRAGAAFESTALQPFKPEWLLEGMLAKAYAALANDDFDGMEQQLAAAELLAHQLRRTRDGWTIRVLRAIAWRKRDPATAQAWLSETLGLAELGGNARLLADTHPLAVQMATAWQVSGKSPPGEQAATDSWGRTPLPTDPARSSSDLLTTKEYEVLQLLQRGLSNKLIARDLGISSETVKWHLKNLFLKLSAGTRRHAVERARMLGLVEVDRISA